MKFLLFLLLTTQLFSSTEESLFWIEVKDTGDIELLELFKIKYPNSSLVIFADKKIQELDKTKIDKNITLFSHGIYKCKKLSLNLNSNNSVYYYEAGQKYCGVWSSDGISANLYFNENGLDTLYNIRQKYGKYIIYKNNKIFCEAIKN